MKHKLRAARQRKRHCKYINIFIYRTIIYSPKPIYFLNVSLALTCIAHDDHANLNVSFIFIAVIICQKCKGFRVNVKHSQNSLSSSSWKVLSNFHLAVSVAVGAEHLVCFLV